MPTHMHACVRVHTDWMSYVPQHSVRRNLFWILQPETDFRGNIWITDRIKGKSKYSDKGGTGTGAALRFQVSRNELMVSSRCWHTIFCPLAQDSDPREKTSNWPSSGQMASCLLTPAPWLIDPANDIHWDKGKGPYSNIGKRDTVPTDKANRGHCKSLLH